jgi:non-ribosomal peptide synthetase component F
MAWALVLSRYTGSAAPCFGNLSSGRDAPIDGVNDIIGPLIGMLPCRVQLDGQLSVLETLRSIQRDHVNALAHQNFSLASIHSLLRLGTHSLFNSCLTIKRTNDLKPEHVPEVVFEMQEGQDQAEVSPRTVRLLINEAEIL